MTTTAEPVAPQKIEIANKPFCCYVFEDTSRECRHVKNAAMAASMNPAKAKEANQSQAIYEITFGPGIEDYTHACTWHVGPMLLTADGDDETETTWSVRMVVDHDGTVLED